MKIVIIVAALFCSLFCGCSDVHDYAEVDEESVIDGLSLHYSVASLGAETYLIDPEELELEIHSVYYVFIGKSSDVVLGTSFRSGLKIGGHQGTLPLIIPDHLLNDDKGYNVRVIVNWENYVRGGKVSLGKVQALLDAKEQATMFFDELSSNYNNNFSLKTLDVTAKSVLLTGSFTYTAGGGNALVNLQRKSVVFDVSVLIPKHINPISYSVEGGATEVSLFNSNLLVRPDTLTSTSFVPNDAKRFRFYTLPNSLADMTLVMKAEISSRVLDTITDNILLYKEFKEVKYFRFPLSVDKLSTVYENQYVSLNLFESLAHPDVLQHSVNGWSRLPFTGTYLRDAQGNGAGVSPTNLRFAFADTQPSKIGTLPPTGKLTEEISVASIGVNSGWDFKSEEGIPDWLSVRKNPFRSTLIVEAEPNFVLDRFGRIHSFERSFNFTIVVKALDGTELVFPITIRQNASPVIPSEVDCGDVIVSDRYLGATSPFYYSTAGEVGSAKVGEEIAKGLYQSNLITDADSIYGRCNEQSRTLMTGVQAVFSVYPRMRFREMLIEGRPYLVYYLSDGKNLSFFNISGNTQTPNATITHIYTDNRKTKLKYGQKSERQNLKIHYGMRLGAESLANTEVVANGDDMNHLIRCVKIKK